MNVSTKKLDAGRYAVLVDGRQTRLVIEKGEAPKYRQRQEWYIGVVRENADYPDWLSHDQTSLAGAVATVTTILEATR